MNNAGERNKRPVVYVAPFSYELEYAFNYNSNVLAYTLIQVVQYSNYIQVSRGLTLSGICMGI